MRAVVLTALLLAACGGGDDPPPPIFAEDYASTFEEVRDCRRSLDHDLQYIRVLAAGDALTRYMDRTDPFVEGDVVLKEQYSEIDTTCSGEIVQWTVMRKLADGADGVNLDWEWQRVNADREVDTDEDPRQCSSCHSGCGEPPDGFDGTCAVE